MRSWPVFLFSVFIISAFHISCSSDLPDEKRTMVVMRDIGNQVLWSIGDSTTRILPVQRSGETYVIEFEKTVPLDYEAMVPIVSDKLHAEGIHGFLAELKDCSTDEVVLAFAYEATSDSLVPCRWRDEPGNCYRIEITPQARRLEFLGLPFALAGVSLAALIYFLTIRKEDKEDVGGIEHSGKGISLGSFLFIPEERMLLLEGTSVNLTEKETKLLVMLVERLGQTYSREDLMTGIWGEEGVQVIPRNIDVLVSKLRKKLQGDLQVQLENVHGVGYKLVINTESN